MSVIVVGGGLAGIAAALRCADAGHEVTLIEAKARLGGLATSFRRGGLTVDNGQHVFLRCCVAYRALLARLGATRDVVLQDRLTIPIRTPDGRRARLRRGRLPAPLHLATTLLTYRLLTPRQRVSSARAALAMRAVDRTGVAADERAFGDWLATHGQDDATVAALWDLVGVATLNARAADASLAAAAAVFQIGLLTDASAADLGWSAVPLARLHDQAASAALAAAGVRVRAGERALVVRPHGRGWSITTPMREYAAQSVILAAPPHVTATLAPPGAREAAAACAALGCSPIVNLHLVLDRRVMDTPFLAGVGTPVQWVFDRTGPSGLPGGQYLAVSLSAADAYVDVPVAVLRERFLPELTALLPGLRTARVVDFFVTRERRATPRPVPGSGALRPAAATAAPGLYLAGAWTDTGWPATMEGAVRSGEAAAAAVCVPGTRSCSADRPATRQGGTP